MYFIQLLHTLIGEGSIVSHEECVDTDTEAFEIATTRLPNDIRKGFFEGDRIRILCEGEVLYEAKV